VSVPRWQVREVGTRDGIFSENNHIRVHTPRVALLARPISDVVSICFLPAEAEMKLPLRGRDEECSFGKLDLEGVKSAAPQFRKDRKNATVAIKNAIIR
jgi:hypothetical protein